MTASQHQSRIEDDEDPLLAVAEAADRAGLKKATWRSYVARNYAPKPDDPDDTDALGREIKPKRRRPRWRASTVDAFRNNRLGQGRRTDRVAARVEKQAQMAMELAAPPPAPAPDMEQWLATNHRALLAVAEALVDHREELLVAVSRPELVAEAIDAAGMHLSGRPSRALASAVAYAMGLLRPDALTRLADDGEVGALLTRHRRLRDEFIQIRDRK